MLNQLKNISMDQREMDLREKAWKQKAQDINLQIQCKSLLKYWEHELRQSGRKLA